MVLTKQDYNNYVKKLDNKKQQDRRDFLKSLPFFRTWTSKMLTKLLDWFVEVNLIRNQVIYSEGEPSKHVYLVQSGEYLLTKRVPMKGEYQIQLEKLIGPTQASLQEHPRVDELKVVKSALGDQGPKSAAQANPTPGKLDQQTLTKTKMHGAFKLISLASG